MRLLISWLRDFVDVTASAEDIAEGLALRGFEVASVERRGDDAVIDFEITANRPDCMSVLGLAREVATLYDLPLALPSPAAGARVALKPAPLGESDRLRVTIEDAELCPRYAAAVADVSIGPSPVWLASRLLAVGIRPISSIVDITNYVLIELGHPMHAFDLSTLAGSEIRVRRSRPGEAITTLDAASRTLEPDMLVIADATRAQAVAGVMGGASSEVTEATKTVAFESAYFKPASVRRTSKRLGLKTEASSRFERGADINAPVPALQRAIALMEQIGAGQLAGPIIDRYPRPRQAVRLHLRRARLALLLGARVADPDVDRILRGLGLTVVETDDGWDIIAPTARVDLRREVDLIEEVGRHHGFDRLEPTFPAQTAPAPPADPRIARDQLVRRTLTAAGLSEAVTFGFLEAAAAEVFAPARDVNGVVRIANPLSGKFNALRPSLLPGLIESVSHNRRHGTRDVRLFEIGARFAADAGETRGVGLAWTGAASDAHWSGAAREVDFFDVKGVTEELIHELGVAARFEPTEEAFLVPGRSAQIVTASGEPAGTRLGVVGQIAPEIAEARGLPRQDRLFAAELNLDACWFARVERPAAATPLPRHPFVVRDLSIVVTDTLPAEIIRGTIRSAGDRTPAPLAAVAFFDRYQGKGIADGAVSLSVRMTFQAPDRTLTDAEVQASVDTILESLVREHGAIQR
jgi:phenylalanyl-tRNA synthetase beta chain